MKIKYYGYWTDGNTYNREAYEFTSLRDAKRTMRKIAAGNNTGSGATWFVNSAEQEADPDRGDHAAAGEA